MRAVIQIFGFGSHFSKASTPTDIDLLILHENLSKESIRFALHVKSRLMLKAPPLDITILSMCEEKEKSFLLISGAKKIIDIDQENSEVQIDQFIRKLTSH